jgi:hypothetical protein
LQKCGPQIANYFIILKVVPVNSKQATAYELAAILAGFLNLYADRSNWMRESFIILKKWVWFIAYKGRASHNI